MNGEKKRLSELKVDSYFVFTNRKKTPCMYKGKSKWLDYSICLWTEFKEHGRWTQFGQLWVIDYGDELPDELDKKRIKHLESY